MMTLDEAIKHCNEVACKHDKCATEHKQLAEWLTELKSYRASVTPATKEQRDTLIKAMANAGHTLDFEKKELKKIESKKLDPDKVIAWLNDQACQGWIEDVEVDKFVASSKKTSNYDN